MKVSSANADGRANNIALVNGKLYTILSPGGFAPSVACVDPTTMTLCAGYPVQFGPTSYYPNTPFGTSTVSGTRIYFNRPTALIYEMMLDCFDTATNSRCAGWTGAVAAAANNGHAAGQVMVSPDGSRVCNATAATLGVPLPDNAGTRCYSTANGSFVGTLTGLDALIDTVHTTGSSYANFEGFTIEGTKVYVPVTYAPTNTRPESGAVVCYDWATGTGCAGFTPPKVPDTKYQYAVVQDDVLKGCGWALGDGGKMFSFDLASGATPCLQFSVETAVDTAGGGYYCDGLPLADHLNGWKTVEFNPAVDPTQWTTLKAVVKDENTGAIVRTLDLLDPAVAPGGVADISDIDIAAHPALSVSLDGEASNPAVWNGAFPTIALTFDGDNPQMCFKTTVIAECSVTQTSNVATVETDTTLFTVVDGVTTFDPNIEDADPKDSNIVTLDVAPPPGCVPETTSTTTTSTTSTTAPPDTTSTTTTTTTPPDTTSTTTTTTTPPDTTNPPVTPSTTPPPSNPEPPSTSPQGVSEDGQQSGNAPQQVGNTPRALPRTGAETDGLLPLGAGLFVLGVALVLVGQRRRLT